MKKFFRKLHNLFRRNRGTFKKGDIIAFPTIDEMHIHSNSGIYSVSASHTHKVKIYKRKTFKIAKLLWLRDLRFSFKYPSHEMRTDDIYFCLFQRFDGHQNHNKQFQQSGFQMRLD